MGNKCCSRRHDPERPLVYPAYKNETGFTACPSLETRYTGEPNNRGMSRPLADIVRTRNPGKCITNGGRRIVKALCAYEARAESDISFRKGDRMEVLSDAEPDWWRVLHLTTRREGLVPVNFVAEESSVECEDWFFPHVSRKEADKLLLAESNPRGTFLVRPAEHNPHGFSLSVKDWEEGRGYHVKHYKIKPLDNGGFYIATNQTFPSLPALVMSYTKNALGLCHVLARPCPKPEPQMWDLGPELRDKWEIPRSEIQLIRKLGQGNFGEVYYGKWRNNIEVAVKTLREGTMSTQAFLQEAAIMKKFRHKQLVALYAVCSQQEPVYIVQEYMSQGSLLEFLRNGEGKFLQFEDLIFIAAQVASVYPAYKNETGFTACPSLETRYTGEPNNRGMSRPLADIVRTRNPGKCITNGGRRIVKALCAYEARAESDISFRKGDRMEVLSDAEPDWWRVLHLTTRREGLVPVNFVAEESSVECEDWFFPHVSRKEADKLLLAESNPRGTFLVRPAEHNPHGFSLSVKDWEEGRGYHVKHYKIKPLDNGGFYIATNQTFPSLPALVMSYTKNALGLCHVLARPCPKPEPQMWDLGPELRDKWEIPRSEIQLIRKLGQGNFGEVYYGKWRNNIEVAVKTLREGTMSTQAFLQEAAIMKKFRHKQLVALYAVCSQQEPVYIVQEYMSQGSLLEFLRNGEGKFLQFEDLIFIAAQVASGMEYLESKLLIHRDLAARNVLIGKNNMAKICDFGLARVIEDNEYCPKQGSRFPVKWTAPEAIIYGRFSIKSDVWSYGILLMELFTYGQIPYPGLHGKDVIEQVERGYRMPKPVGHYLPDDIYRLMLQCWDAIPEKRPTFEFLNHYFESFTVTSEIPYREVQD